MEVKEQVKHKPGVEWQPEQPSAPEPLTGEDEGRAHIAEGIQPVDSAIAKAEAIIRQSGREIKP